eukprot:4192896-Amphidinium_carterae.1
MLGVLSSRCTFRKSAVLDLRIFSSVQEVTIVEQIEELSTINLVEGYVHTQVAMLLKGKMSQVGHQQKGGATHKRLTQTLLGGDNR